MNCFLGNYQHNTALRTIQKLDPPSRTVSCLAMRSLKIGKNGLGKEMDLVVAFSRSLCSLGWIRLYSVFFCWGVFVLTFVCFLFCVLLCFIACVLFFCSLVCVLLCVCMVLRCFAFHVSSFNA